MVTRWPRASLRERPDRRRGAVDLGVLVAASRSDRQQRLAMLTVCEAMTAGGGTKQDILEVRRVLGLDSVVLLRGSRGFRRQLRTG
jgi:hypothetical protein